MPLDSASNPSFLKLQSRLNSLAVMLISRGLILRDSLLGVTQKLRRAEHVEQFFFPSGERSLAAASVIAGGSTDSTPMILICHGIGETAEHWSAVQAYLQERGVSSMVFSYSGYGASSGAIRTGHCDEDLISAYVELRRRIGPERPVFVLGFSLGSGIAAAGIGSLQPPPAGLFLCEAFSSFREAAQAGGCPAWLARQLPNIWNTAETIQSVRLPVCVIHSDADRLFPIEMAQRITTACGLWGELIVVPGLSHNEPCLRPTGAYWDPIAERVLRAASPAHPFQSLPLEVAVSTHAV
jgi:uncharacterized protein